MSVVRRGATGLLAARLSRLRYPTLFLLAGGLFLADVLIPDAIPLADELLLGVLTAFLASLRHRGKTDPEPAAPATDTDPQL